MEEFERIATLQSRANACVFLAQLYRRELSPDVVLRLNAQGLFGQLEDNGYDFERKRLSEASFLGELAHEYTRVFIGPGAHVAPYGSVHHPGDPKRGRLWGDSTAWVRRFVLDHGLSFDGEAYDGIPDHVSHELEFYAHLLEAELESLRLGKTEQAARLRNSQEKFFGAQLARWLPPFCKCVHDAAELGFYAELARLTEDLVEAESLRLEPTPSA